MAPTKPNARPDKFTDEEWYALNVQQRSYWRHREKRIAATVALNRKRREENPEIARKDKAYHVRNKDRYAEMGRIRYIEKGPELREQARQRRVENLEEYREKDNARYERDREKRKLIVIKGDLRKKEALAGRPKPESCELCGRLAIGDREMHFDHCHTSGQFRGWICRYCNVVLGMVDDDPAWLRKIADYAERHSKLKVV